MNLRTLLSVIVLLAHESTIASADTMSVSIACDASTGANLQTALSDFYSSGKNALDVTVAAGGLCQIGSNAFPISGAVSVDIHGAGTSESVFFMSGVAVTVFQVTNGAQLSLSEMNFESASHGVVSVTNGTLSVDQMFFSSNQSGSGGAISASNSAVTIDNSTFNGNASSLDGGAIAMTGGGSLTVSDSAFVLNQTLSSGVGDGGAIYSNAVTVNINRVLFDSNKSQNNRGGAVYVESGNLTIRNSTFNGNQAVWGGAIATIDSTSSATLLNNVTLRGDSASMAGSELYAAEMLSPSPYTITNSLISGTCSGLTALPTAHNSIESPGNTCLLNPASNEVSVADASLFLGPLADNGGPTKTILPYTGSPLINAGGNDCEKVDQRDFARNVGVCDVGALEVGAVDLIFGNGFEVGG